MADPRVSEHAKIIVNYSCRVKRNDFVLITAARESHDLVAALASELGRVGARFVVVDSDLEFDRAYALAADEETLSSIAPQVVELVRTADVFVHVLGHSNAHEMSDVPPSKLQVSARAGAAMGEAMEGKRWNITLHPTRAMAQEAKMPYEAYCDFVYSAILRDWPKFETEMRVLSERLAKAREVRVVGKDTDITLSVKGRRPKVSAGDHNMPSGEVFVSPVDTEVEGHVYFDLPVVYQGHEIRGARLTFRNGVAAESGAEEGADLLKAMLDVDEGARRLGELGIGMNRGIDRFTRNILFDEKMGDTVHMAVGRAYPETGGTNKSAIHIDMIKSMKEDGAIYLDGVPAYEKGKFVWE
ncbi:MAG: aminopeptidase [Nitrososphaerota archaeon]|nr:aminopeptidase [Nitrososphaerota archaeon]